MSCTPHQTDHYHNTDADQKPPQGHLPEAYEMLLVSEKDKLDAVTKLKKLNIPHKMSVRNGQFYLQFSCMQDFTNASHAIAK